MDLVTFDVDGYRLLLRPYSESDNLIVEEIWSNKDTYKINDKPNNVVLDLGGNIGLFSLWITKNNPDALVISYEPEQENFEIFRRNIEENKANITLVNQAVSDFVGTLYLDGNHGLTSTNRIEGQQEIACTTLNHIVKANNLTHIDILKIDVEGAEYEIFSCIEDEILKSIQYITMEVHYVDEERLNDLLSVLNRYHDVLYEQSDFYPIRGGMLYASRRLS